MKNITSNILKRNILINNEQDALVLSKIDDTLSELAPIKSDFRLINLANLIDYPSEKISKLLKKVYGKNFNQIVNLYRLEYMENLIYKEVFNKKKINISELIKQSGFNSRNSYYVFLKARNELKQNTL
jgi:AraC-like DNA-binding protein